MCPSTSSPTGSDCCSNSAWLLPQGRPQLDLAEEPPTRSRPTKAPTLDNGAGALPVAVSLLLDVRTSAEATTGVASATAAGSGRRAHPPPRSGRARRRMVASSLRAAITTARRGSRSARGTGSSDERRGMAHPCHTICTPGANAATSTAGVKHRGNSRVSNGAAPRPEARRPNRSRLLVDSRRADSHLRLRSDPPGHATPSTSRRPDRSPGHRR